MENVFNYSADRSGGRKTNTIEGLTLHLYFQKEYPRLRTLSGQAVRGVHIGEPMLLTFEY